MGIKTFSLLSLLFILVSCRSENTPENTNEFDLNKYNQENYMKNLNLLIQKQEVDISDFKYVVVYTEKQHGKTASCAKETVLGSITELLSLANKIVIISNEESFVPKGFESRLFDEKSFKKYDVFHSAPYIYEINNNQLINGEVLNNEKIEELKAIG